MQIHVRIVFWRNQNNLENDKEDAMHTMKIKHVSINNIWGNNYFLNKYVRIHDKGQEKYKVSVSQLLNRE